MRTLIIADVHANFSALAALPQADLILCAGDVVTFGPDPADCIEWLSLRRSLCVRGDEDDAVGNAAEHQLPDHLCHAGTVSRSWTKSVLSPSHRSWLAELPPELEAVVDGHRLSVVHAYPGDYSRYLRPTEEELHRLTRAFPRADVIVIGHTHRPGCWRYRGKVIVNPGSVGQSAIAGKASYALLHDGRITLGSIAYDHLKTQRRLQQCGMDPAAATCCAHELRNGSPRPTSRLDPAARSVPA